MSASARTHRQFLLLAAITALGSLAIHMYVPAMPLAAVSLGANRAEVQLALTIYMIGIAVGQVASGPLSDRLGRRPALLGGAALFVVGSLLCWSAQSIVPLLAGRLIQALGAASGLVAARAVIGDSGGGKGARDMALLTAITLLSPMFAPMLGSLLANAAGWRAIFAVLALAGLICGAMIARWMPETMAPPSEASRFWRDWALLAREPRFLRNVAVTASMSGALYVFLTASPFLMVEVYHVDVGYLGLCYGLVAVGAAGGALSASALASRLTPRQIIGRGTMVSAVAAAIHLGGAILGSHHIAALIAPMMIFSFGGGLAMPTTLVAALAQLKGRIGTAVSMYGALQMGANALATFVVAMLPHEAPLLPAALMAGLSLTAVLLHLSTSE